MIAQIDSNFIKSSLKKTYTRLLSYIFYEGRPLTTKGRWINTVVFLLYRLQSRLPFGMRVKKPIFILGTGRSGTTILGITLGIHNDVGFLNEPKALWSYLHDNEDLIGSYNLNQANYRLFAKDASVSLIKKAHQIYGNYLRYSLSSRVVDKYPELVYRTKFVSAIFPDARFLFLYRNGYDTCHSIRFWSERLGVESRDELHDWWGKGNRKWHLLCNQIVANDDALYSNIQKISQYSNHEYRAAVEWIVTMKEGIALMKSNPTHVMGVKYEDYVDCRDVRQNVLDFCELGQSSQYESYCKNTLRPPKVKEKIDLPIEIQDEFNRVMRELGYE